MSIPADAGRPLSPAALNILLALSDQPMHGYAIMKEVERQSARQYRIGPGTLYDNLRHLMNDGFVEDYLAEDGDSRRKYRMTKSGAVLLTAELESLQRVLRAGRKRLRAWHREETV